MGSVRARGRTSWLLDYYEPNGHRCRDTIKVRGRAEAERELKKREGDLAHGRPLFASADKVTFDDLAKDFVRDYEVNASGQSARPRRARGD
jgi:hypothetical protein